MEVKYHNFIIYLNEAYDYLIKNINVENGSYYDETDPGKISVILKELVYILLDSNVSYNDTLQLIINKLMPNHYDRIYIQEICDNTLNLIADKITRFVPELSDDRYRSDYIFQVVRRDAVVITHKSH